MVLTPDFARPLRRGLVLALIFAAWYLAGWSAWTPLRLVLGALLVHLVPGLAVLRLARIRVASRAGQALLAGVLSPPVLGALAALGAIAGGTVPDAGLPVLVLCGLVVAWPRRSGRGTPASNDAARAGTVGVDGLALALGLACAALTAIGYLRPWVRNWSDAWTHAAFFEEILRSGIPPQFPHFAGFPIPYPWFVHVYLAAESGIVSRDPFVLLATLNTWTALLFPLAVHALARTAGLGPVACRWSAVAGVVGVNPLGPVWLFGQTLMGETSGLKSLAHSVANGNRVIGALSFHFPSFQSSLFGRWWTPTAYNFGLLLMTLVFALFLEYWQRPRPRVALGLGAAMTMLLHWHTLTALHGAIGLVVALPVACVASPRGERAAAFRRALVLGGCLAAAYVLSRPYLALATVGQGIGRVMLLRPSISNLVGLVLSMGPVALAGAIGVWRVGGPRRMLLLGLVAGLLGPYLFFDLPGTPEEKFYFPLFLPLAALAGEAVAQAWRRAAWLRFGIAALVAGGVLTTGITAWAFLRDPRPVRLLFATVRPGDPSFLTADEDSALRWIRERAPRDAVFLQYPRPNGPEPILVVGRRRLYLGRADSFYETMFHSAPGRPPAPPAAWSELQRRRALQLAAFAERAMAPDSLAWLRSYPWPVLVWWDQSLGGGTLSPSLRPGAGASLERFATPTVRLLEVLPRSAGAADSTGGRR